MHDKKDTFLISQRTDPLSCAAKLFMKTENPGQPQCENWLIVHCSQYLIYITNQMSSSVFAAWST